MVAVQGWAICLLQIVHCKLGAWGRMKRSSKNETDRRYKRGVGYIRQRESDWKKRGITFNGLPLTWDIWQQLLELQNNQCAICHRDSFWGNLHAEHCHATGELRGACDAECNRYALGGYEKTGHYKSSSHEHILQVYLDNPPAERLKRKLGLIK